MLYASARTSSVRGSRITAWATRSRGGSHRPPLPAGQGTVPAGEGEEDVAVGSLPHAGDLHDLGERQFSSRGIHTVVLPAVEQTDIGAPLKDKLVSDDLGLPPAEDDPAFQQLCGGGFAGGEGYLFGEGEGLFLDTGGEVDLLGLGELFHAPFRGVRHLTANTFRHGGKDGHIHRRLRPHQYFSGIDRPGVGPAEPGTGRHRAAWADVLSLRAGAEGDGNLQVPHPALSVRQIKDAGPDRPCQLHSALHGLFAPQQDLAVGLHHAKDIGAGVRDDHLQSLLLEKCRVQQGLVSVQLRPVQF